MNSAIEKTESVDGEHVDEGGRTDVREKTRSRPRVAVVGTLDPRDAGEGKEATMMSLNCRMVGVGSLREEATEDARLHRSM